MWIANVVEQVFGEILWEVLRGGVIYRNNITNKRGKREPIGRREKCNVNREINVRRPCSDPNNDHRCFRWT